MRGGLVLAGVAVFLLAACGPAPEPRPGIETRVHVDRTETTVGTPLGITIEVDTPEGYGVEAPDRPPNSEGFSTEAVELLDALETRQGVRHRLLWTVRARATGDQRLPELRIPLVRPDGGVLPLAVGATPVRVRSVRAELPEREIFFDIRPAPEPQQPRGPYLVAGAAAIMLALLAALVVRHRRTAAALAGPDRSVLARQALAAVDRATERADALEPRELGAELQRAVLGFVAATWDVDERVTTPGELPERVDSALAGALGALERSRFARAPARLELLAGARDARQRLVELSGDVARH